MISRNKKRLARQRAMRRLRRRQAPRRGVLLLVVLSMLVLFMMIGTAFLLTSGQYRSGAREAAKVGRLGNQPTELLDRALYQVLRDTNNPFSAVRYHSLLRDMYGTDGFEGVVQSATFAGALLPPTDDDPNPELGPTRGQLIDIYVQDLDAGTALPEPIHVIKLDRGVDGETVDHTLPLANGYYSGSLLTITSGAAHTQSGRIVAYDLFEPATRVFRIRVMAFPRADGSPLTAVTERSHAIPDLAGATFVVNGRPYNGTGVGYNAATTAGQPRLSALHVFRLTANEAVGAELALLPNGVYYDVMSVAALSATAGDPFLTNHDTSDFDGRLQAQYGVFQGPGDTDESYDAPDFQNMFLAHETVTPRARGRLVVDGVPLLPDDPTFQNGYEDVERIDVEDLPIPSFHRPALVNFWFHRLMNSEWLKGRIGDETDRLKAIVGDPTFQAPPDVAAKIAELKRRISLRPLREDHPNFDGSNPRSTNSHLVGAEDTVVDAGGTPFITAPYWEATGPWDVDNDKDGIPDSNWIDLGDPVQQAEDGTLYQPLYAFKIIDFDNRLNVNAHGTAEHVNPPRFDAAGETLAGFASSDMMPQGMGWGPADISLRPLFPVPYDSPPGNRVEDFNGNGVRQTPFDGDLEVDSYATLLAGRLTASGLGITGRYGFDSNYGNDTDQLAIADVGDAGPGVTDASVPDFRMQFDFHDYPLRWADPDQSYATGTDLMGRFALGLGHFGHTVYEAATQPNWPILAGSPYELDLSQEARRGVRSDGMLLRRAERDSQVTQMFDAAGRAGGTLTGYVTETDDAPFAIADMERLLRANEYETGALPSRLWDVVDSFDPRKLVYDPRIAGNPNNPTSLEYVAAEEQAAINRRLATTDSYDLPTPGGSFYGRLLLGVDGAPGIVDVNDDGDSGDLVDDPLEVGFEGSDDYEALMGSPPPSGAGIIDLLAYRVRYEQWKQLGKPDDFLDDHPVNAAEIVRLNAIVRQLLPPEVIAGQRMDINRPFGNGRDDNRGGNGVVDEPGEASGDEPLWQSAGSAMNFAGLPVTGVPMDLTNGIDVNGDGWVNGLKIDPNAPAQPLNNNYTADAELARQLYARHLYVMMMMLTDEEYVASQTAGIPNNEEQVESLALQIAAENDNVQVVQLRRDPTPQEEAEAMNIAVRKLTARRIAQWAINCADFRDPDAIMTPFEYDENPWDGWGLSSTGDAIDGNLATNENFGPDGAPGRQNVDDDGDGLVDNSTEVGFNGSDDPAFELRTRSVVWGAERPELLITETFAFHDRQATDEQEFINPTELERGPGNGQVHHQLQPTAIGEQQYADDDLDQKLLPRGALFIELYNPWTDDTPKPAEFYRYAERPTAIPQNAATVYNGDGVMLNRLSDVALDGKHSPVWRLAVIKDPTTGRMTRNTYASVLEAQRFAGEQLSQVDPDGFGFESDEDAERQIYFTTGPTSHIPRDRIEFNNPTTDFLDDHHLRIRIPSVFSRDLGTRGVSGKKIQMTRRYFPAVSRGQPSFADQGRALGPVADIPIAPVKPGRYAVIGPSGMQLSHTNPRAPRGDVPIDRYVTPIGHLTSLGGGSDFRPANDVALRDTRRIELMPSLNPDLQQIHIDDNGDLEFLRVVEQPRWNNNRYVNFTDVDDDGRPDLNPARPFVVPPTVAIPIEDLNISKPVGGYLPPNYRNRGQYVQSFSHRYAELFAEVPHTKTDGTPAVPGVLNTSPSVDVTLDGEFQYDKSYDRPFDLEFDLVRNGTTPNYRSVHLQRLANPLLPWNPPPFDEDGNPNARYDNRLAVNPYMTIDSMSVDLTAFNGASTKESDGISLPNNSMFTNGYTISDDPLTQGDYQAPLVPADVLDAPDHVLREFLDILRQYNIPVTTRNVNQYRNAPTAENDVENALRDLERKRWDGFPNGAEVQQQRDALTSGHDDGEWGWHALRRYLPNVAITRDIASRPGANTDQFRQRLHLKSLERGYHTRSIGPRIEELGAGDTLGWMYNPGWVPRLLWAQEPPNRNVILPGAAGGQPIRASDMVNVIDRDLLENKEEPDLQGRELSDDEKDRHVFMMEAVNGNPRVSRSTHIFDFVMEHTLGMANEAYVPEIDGLLGPEDEVAVNTETVGFGAPLVTEGGIGQPDEVIADPLRPGNYLDYRIRPHQELGKVAGNSPNEITPDNEQSRREKLLSSTYPWFPWNDRPYISQNELMQVPASSSSLMLREYSVVNTTTANPYDGGTDPTNPQSNDERLGHQHAPFGHLLNFMLSSPLPADTSGDDPTGAPNFSRILEFLQVPSRFVNTDTLLNPVEFSGLGAVPITSPEDPRVTLRPPFNRVSNFRDPGRVNLNTVSGRRVPATASAPPQIWSEVFDGIMHRLQDGERYLNGEVATAGHYGPAWRDVVLSRRGYAQFNANNLTTPVEKLTGAPDVLQFGLNRNFPTFFANPFRAPDAGDLVPLPNMVQVGVNASYLRAHPYNRGNDNVWGGAGEEGFSSQFPDDTREAGFNDDTLTTRTTELVPRDPNLPPPPPPLSPEDNRPLPNVFASATGGDAFSGIPLFSESLPSPQVDAERNPYFFYQPLTRMGNMVTTRSGVFAVWVTVGYFEVEPAPDWNEIRDLNNNGTADGEEVRERFGAENGLERARELYDRVYPDGMQLGREMGIDTGNARRHRAFYIVDRTLPVAFKPGSDLNVEQMIRLRRRIE